MTEEIQNGMRELQRIAYQRGVMAAADYLMSLAKDEERQDLERAALAIAAADIHLQVNKGTPYDRRDSDTTK